MEKLIKKENEYYLLNDELVKRGDKAMDKNNHIQTYNPYGSDYDNERNFTKVIASTDPHEGLPMLNRVQIESVIGEGSKEFTLKQLTDSIRLTWAHQQIRLTVDPHLGSDVDELIDQMIPIMRTKQTQWNVEVEMEHSRVVGGGLVSVGDFGGKGPQVYEHSAPKRNEQGYITIKSIKQ